MLQSRFSQAIQFYKKRPAVPVIELILVIAAFFMALRPMPTPTISLDSLEPLSESVVLQTDDQGRRGVPDVGTDFGGNTCMTPSLALKAGRYLVTVEYDIENYYDGNERYRPSFSVYTDAPTAALNYTGCIATGSNEQTFSVVVRRDYPDVRLTFDNNRCRLMLGSITVVPDRRFALLIAFCLLFGFLLLDVLFLYLLPSGPWALPAGTRVTILALGGIVCLSSMLILKGGVLYGHDYPFHLSRIEGIAQALREGQFPVRIMPQAKDGYGYGCSLFYGQLFLYFPAVLRLLGCNVQEAYYCYLFAVNTATVCIAYYSFHGILRRRLPALLTTLAFTLCYCRMANIYVRFAVGEYTAMAFCPLIVYALWLLYGTSEPEKDSPRPWLLLMFGFSGFVQTHLLTLEMATVTCAAIGLVFWRKTFRRSTLLAWGKAAVGTVLLNLWFLVPFVQGMLMGVQITGTKMDIDLYGIPPLGLFFGGPVTGLGPTLAFGVFAFLFVLLLQKDTNAPLCRFGIASLVIGCITAYFSTDAFPWDSMQNIPLLGNMVSSLQFPWRWLGISALALSMILGCAFVLLEASEKKSILLVFTCCVLSLTGYSMSQLYTPYVMELPPPTVDPSQLINPRFQNAMDWPFDDLYLPEETVNFPSDDYPATPTNAVLTDLTRQGPTLTATCTNTTAEEGFIELPLLYYPGYKVLTGNATLYKAGDGLVGVSVPAGFDGTFSVAYREPKRWLLADGISVLALIGLIAYNARRKKRLRVIGKPAQ